jgi:hypothetical protein
MGVSQNLHKRFVQIELHGLPKTEKSAHPKPNLDARTSPQSESEEEEEMTPI